MVKAFWPVSRTVKPSSSCHDTTAGTAGLAHLAGGELLELDVLRGAVEGEQERPRRDGNAGEQKAHPLAPRRAQLPLAELLPELGRIAAAAGGAACQEPTGGEL